MMKKCSLEEDKKDELIDFVKSSPDIKKEDAKELLNYIKDELI